MSVDQQLDKIFDVIDDLFWEGKFEQADKILSEVSVEGGHDNLLNEQYTTSHC